MATTTNFGWETPDDTDLVKDGAAAIRTLGGAIDTSLVDLKGGTTGQVLSKASNTDMDFSWIEQDDTTLSFNAQTGTTYTLALTDAHKLVTLSNASSITATVPPNSSVAFETGDQVNLLQLGAGQVTVAAGSGVTIRSEGSKLKLKGQYATATLVKIGTDEWVLLGNTAA